MMNDEWRMMKVSLSIRARIRYTQQGISEIF
jgi:hypothetical protein